MMLKEHVRDARHRIAEIVGGLTGPQDYELDCVLTAIFDDLLAVQRERDAELIETKAVVSIPGQGWQLIDDNEPDRVRQTYAVAIRAQL